MHKKGITEEVAKKRSRKNVKHQVRVKTVDTSMEVMGANGIFGRADLLVHDGASRSWLRTKIATEDLRLRSHWLPLRATTSESETLY